MWPTDADAGLGERSVVTTAIFIIMAGLMGASGVALLAVSAHAAPGAGLDSAGQILLFHAAALVAGVALHHGGLLQGAARSLGLVALMAFVVGALLFSGDIALRAVAGHRLFPFAAPTGGIILILGWLVMAVAGVITVARSG
jgi:uncharacterized membrane protein YgdD (TMEM256/DUF423 family)